MLILVVCMFCNQTISYYELLRNTSIVPREQGNSPTKIEKLRSEVSKVLNCNTRIMCYVRVCLLIALHWDHVINHWHFIFSIYAWHSLRYIVMHHICIIMKPCMIFRKTCKSCMKCLNAVYAKLRNKKFSSEAKLRVFVPLLRGCKTDKFLVASDGGL